VSLNNSEYNEDLEWTYVLPDQTLNPALALPIEERWSNLEVVE